jgi:multiple sugar transport system substrate-binding protein
MYKPLSRRDFLKVSGGMAAGGLLASGLPAFAQDGVTIRSHTRSGRQADAQKFWAEQFNEDMAGEASVVIEDFPGSEYFQKINTLAAGGTMGDVIWISSIEGYFRLAATGVLQPIDDIIDSLGYDLEEHYPATISAARLNGKLYGIPILAHPGRVGLFYNKTIFDDAGVDYPDETWTMDDFLAAAIEVTDPDRRIWGFVDPEGSYFTSIVFIRAFGGDTLNADGTESMLNSEESIAALKFQSSLYNEHKVAPVPGTALQGPYQLFAANQLAMFQSGFWGSGVAQFVEDPSIVGVAPMPIGPSGQRGSMFEFDPLCVTSFTENPEEAFKWVDYNTSFDAQLRVTKLHNVTASRPAVMADEVVQESDTLRVFSGVMEDALPLVLPANFRETEHFKFIGDQIQALWLGLGTVDDIIEDINDGAQAILDKAALG